MHLLLAASLAVLATSTLAHEIPAPGWDKYAGERGGDTTHDALPAKYTDLHAREAVAYPESDAMHAWERAHNGQPMKYEAFDEGPEVHGHYFDARDVPQTGEGGDDALPRRDDTQPSARYGEDVVVGLAKDQSAPLSAHGIPDFGDAEVDTSLEGYDHVLARSVMSTNNDNADAPGTSVKVRNEYVRWTGVLPTTEMHFPPSPTRRPLSPSSDTHRSQHSVRDVLGMWWEDLTGGVRQVWE
ncbi:hypothetical protein LTR91_020387 [Friedmanniomyces endolithicus]|uniref:Uncharacterized protein n=1 Tax=Friedmanniomyces endolithicus TaxID=329885 RepID=A0AAN6H8X2_9PEZI|nr:hypothetical protein LTR94_016465 [Friedmanniomyces endolithicus]KAK0789736.1 hypothetical protein LTR75_012268 [Friedmanniomyces endolithicus]KAK0799898.1 hypothetical protein LTR59_005959 [Friedmanniomyces endolithicus]KAK0820253.1 hypothetical protein LTR38_000161 [Friedmanniomyces endolithicus]KAK0850984.1 hypothetical protein LTR03_004273 [Friedmanniomyces endolithicus]